MDINLRNGVVYRKTIGGYSVYVDEQVIECAVSAKLRVQLDSSKPASVSGKLSARKFYRTERTDPVVVGDVVRFKGAQDGSGMIVEVEPRRSKLSRRSAVPMPSARPYEQVIVANIDRAVPVFATARPVPKWRLLDRYLVAAEAAGLPSLICITKLDLVLGQSGHCDGKLLEMMQVYLDIGYPVILTSTRTGEGINQLREALQGSASVFLGKSGVGKSSLLNALLPGLDLDVGKVSQVTGKGKHITSHLEMYDLGSAGAIVDTPGIREFGLWDVDERGLSAYFPEMRPYLGQCKFGLGCRHDQEPGCEVRNAVLAGEISPYRYQSYMRLLFEV